MRFGFPISAASMASLRPRTEQQLSMVYFDGDDLRLARWGLSLRYRGGQGWTLKLPVADGVAAIVRQELVFEGGAGRTRGTRR